MARKSNNGPVTHTKERSVTPVPATIEHIPGYPKKLIIFQVASSPFWWARTYFKGKHVKRSTQTTSKREAIQFAKDFYDHLITGRPVGKVTDVLPQILTTFQKCINGLQEEDEQRAKRKEVTDRYVIEQRRLMDRHIRAYFGSYDVTEIDYPLLDKFTTFLFSQGISNSTIRMHLGVINRVFVYAQKHGYIKTAPIKPTIKAEDNPRGWFDLPDYKKIRKASRRLLNWIWEERQRSEDEDLGKLIRKVIFTPDVYYMIPFMVYTFIRPTELKSMKHKHVEIRESEDGEYLWLPVPTSKGKKTAFISMPRAVPVYRKLREFQESKGMAGPEDYLFFPEYKNRDTAYNRISRPFNLLLEETGTKHSVEGDIRTIYSLRHNSIMFALIYYGVEKKEVIALNARTSVEMVDRFYAAQLESEHVRKQLHSKKAKPKLKPKAKPTNTIVTEPRPATEKELEIYLRTGEDTVNPDDATTAVIEKVIKGAGAKAKVVISPRK
jgi:integrase